MSLVKNLAYGFRWFVYQPGLASAGVVLLTLGIGANTTIFTIVNHLFFSPPPAIQAPEQMVRVNRFSQEHGAEWWSYPDYAFFRERQEVFSGLAAYYPPLVATMAAVEGNRVGSHIVFVSDNYFEVLGVRPVAGRGLLAGSGARPQTEAVISSTLWSRLFQSSPEAIGRALSLNGQHFTIVGVAPPTFRGVSPVEETPDAWLPLTAQPTLTHGSEAGWLDREEGTRVTWLQVLGRLEPGVSVAEAQANLDVVAASLAQELGGRTQGSRGAVIQQSFQFRPDDLGELLRLSRLLMGVVVAVLLIAGANVAILLLARAATKKKEYGVRMAVGASRGRIITYLLADSLALALPGAVGGYVLAFWSSDLAARIFPFHVSGDLRPDLRVLGFTISVAILSALVFGVLPGLKVARGDILVQLKEGSSSVDRSRLRETLVTVQAGLSFLLVVGALLFVRSLIEVRSEPLGFTAEHRLLATVDLGHYGYDDVRMSSFVEAAVERIEAQPGVRRASTTLMIPFGGMWTALVTAPDSGAEVGASLNAVGPAYFDVMEIPIVAGRSFSRSDRGEAGPVVIVNQAASEQLWPGGQALGATVDTGDGKLRTVVGIARNATYHEIGEDPVPHLYLPTLQAGRKSVTFLVETSLEPAALIKPVQEAVHRIDGSLAFARIEPLEQVVDQVASRYRFGALLVTLFGALALLLAATGLYAVLSYLVVQRRKAISIQMALGATRRRVALEVVARGLRLCAAGIVLGVVGTVLGAHLVTSFLYGVSPRDPGSLVLVALILSGVGVVASYLPASRASHVDPFKVLRQE